MGVLPLVCGGDTMALQKQGKVKDTVDIYQIMGAK